MSIKAYRGYKHAFTKGYSLIGWDSLMDCQGAQIQKEGHEDQGSLKQLKGDPSGYMSSLPGLHGLPFGSGLHLNPSGYHYAEVWPWLPAASDSKGASKTCMGT